jgi:hypothetical protein
MKKRRINVATYMTCESLQNVNSSSALSRVTEGFKICSVTSLAKSVPRPLG